MIYFIDLFCGAGGTTTGIERAHINGNRVAKVVACVNHDAKAISSHKANHPDALHFTEDIRTLNIASLIHLVSELRKNNPDAAIAIWASLECTNFSKAKGGKPRDADSRTLANHLFRYIKGIDPDMVWVENVMEFMSWGPLDENGKPISRLNGRDYVKWCNKIQSFGYKFDWRQINSADFGAYTSRSRYFAQFNRPQVPIVWPTPTHAKNPGKEGMFGKLEKWKPVKEVLDLDDHGNSIFGRKKELSPKTLERLYKGAIKHVAGDEEAFLLKYNSTDRNGAHTPPSINNPCPVIATQNRLGICFISKYYGNGDNTQSADIPCGTIRTRANLAKVHVQFLDKHYSGSANHQGIDVPAGTVLSKDKYALITSQFIELKHSQGKQHEDINNPLGAITTVPKANLITAEKFIMDTQYNNIGHSIEKPAPTITANRKHHYLVNPQWHVNSGGSIEDPSFTLIARMDKAPPHMVTTETGDAIIIIYEDDSEIMKKIKEFMALYGIVDIKMRMLKVKELLKIQGFPENYILHGNQADQKKFIGNSVVPHIAKSMVEATANKLMFNQIMESEVA